MTTNQIFTQIIMTVMHPNILQFSLAILECLSK